MKSPVSISRTLSDAADKLTFALPVTHTYNPLNYARSIHDGYVSTYARKSCKVVFMGMNPGPWGMAQTGVPFGEVNYVRDWMALTGDVTKPQMEHPKREIVGLDCHRSEVSGARLWGWAEDRFDAADAFFDRCFVWNYCPLSFMESTGRNRTPDKLPIDERTPLFRICDQALVDLILWLDPEWVIGVGAFAQKRAKIALQEIDVSVGRILHPSPASPKANGGWADLADAELNALGVSLIG